MRFRFMGVVILIILFSVYAAAFPAFEKVRKSVKKMEIKGLIFPPNVIKLFSLEFRTIAADYLFVRVSQFVGGKIARQETGTKEDLDWFYRNLIVITELDPYFEDPYYFGNAVLTWDAGMYNEANDLLQKATDARTWDWQFPFFIGFNKFYFLNDNRGGADYLMMAYKRPGAHSFIPTLAARLYGNAGKTETAIAILIQFWKNANDVRTKKIYETLIDALKKVLFLENAVAQYKKKTGKRPANLEMLIRAGIIEKIPPDPYGGAFYIDKDGSVKTTSQLAPKRQHQQETAT